MELHFRLKEVRTHRKLTLHQLAELTGLHASYLSELERGKGNPTFETLERLANAYQLTVSELLLGVGKKSIQKNIDGLPLELARLVRQGAISPAVANDLNRVQLAGRQPRTEEAWYCLYLYLKQVVKGPEVKMPYGYLRKPVWNEMWTEEDNT